MNTVLIDAGHTFRTKTGKWDLFVLSVAAGWVDYRVENGDLAGTRGKVEIADFARRVNARVPNYVTPGRKRLLSLEES